MKFDESTLYHIETQLVGNRYSLFDTATWKNGLAFKKIDFTKCGMPIIKISELNNGITSTTAYSDKKYSPDVHLTKGDMVFSWSGNPKTSIDIYWYDLPDGWLNQHIFKVSPKKEVIDKHFFYYLMKYLKPTFTTIATNKQTTGLGHITIADLKRLSVIIPERGIQEKVALILKSLDDKIELNNKINKNLMDQMQALYNAWFVDYLPFCGSRPADWSKSDIYKIADVIYGAPFKSKLFNTDKNGKPIVRIRDLKASTLNTYTTEIHPKGYCLQDGDIVVGMDGEFRPYIWGNGAAWLNQRVCVFNNKRRMGKCFLYFTLKPLLNKVEQTEQATTVIHIGKADFDRFEFYQPDESTLDKFDEITMPMYQQIVEGQRESLRLAKMRDILLPKLMSGEINVSDVDL